MLCSLLSIGLWIVGVCGGLLLLLFVIGYVFGDNVKAEPKRPAPRLSVDLVDSDVDDYDEPTVKIAGITFRTFPGDEYYGSGYIVPEPTNKHDRNAMAIYDSDGRLLGYWPKERQRDLREFRRAADVPSSATLPAFVAFYYTEEGIPRTICRAVAPKSLDHIKNRILGLGEWYIKKEGL